MSSDWMNEAAACVMFTKRTRSSEMLSGAPWRRTGQTSTSVKSTATGRITRTEVCASRMSELGKKVMLWRRFLRMSAVRSSP